MTLDDQQEDKESASKLEEGVGLCLSGGGYRAMLFHTGSLWRLLEAGILKNVQRISSVSGGSIVSALLGMKWNNVNSSSDFQQEIVLPIRALARQTLDVKSVLGGIFSTKTIGEKLAQAYDRYLFEGKTLQDLPESPKFIINATNVQSGALWRFSRSYMRDWRVGEILNPTTPLAFAVAASSAFPPVLSPFVLEVNPSAFTSNSGDDLQREPYTSKIFLSDGGVYDNLGIEPVWKRYNTILVSDGGQKMETEEKPDKNWVGHSIRVLDLIDNQVRNLRKRQVIGSFVSNERKGSYWGIRTNVINYGLDNVGLNCNVSNTIFLANIPTRLKELDDNLQEKLINWGYAVTDTAIRAHLNPKLLKPKEFPYPSSGV